MLVKRSIVPGFVFLTSGISANTRAEVSNLRLRERSPMNPNITRRRLLRTRLLIAFVTTLFAVSVFLYQMYFAPRVQALSSTIVISQVYGGGGNAGATYTHDFIELFNRGNTTVSVAGWSVQYTSAAGTGNFGSATNLITPISGTLAPGQYLLIQEATNAAVGAPLPTPPFPTRER